MGLDTALDTYYADTILKGKPKDQAIQSVKTLIDADPAIKAQAQALLLDLDKLAIAAGGKLEKRCFVSHTQRLALQEALNG